MKAVRMLRMSRLFNELERAWSGSDLNHLFLNKVQNFHIPPWQVLRWVKKSEKELLCRKEIYVVLFSELTQHVYHIVTVWCRLVPWQNRLFGQIYRLKDLSGKNAAKNGRQIYRWIIQRDRCVDLVFTHRARQYVIWQLPSLWELDLSKDAINIYEHKQMLNTIHFPVHRFICNLISNTTSTNNPRRIKSCMTVGGK